MAGEQNLDQLLRALQPVLMAEEYVFCTLPPGLEPPEGLAPIGAFLEAEGLTMIMTRQQAEETGIAYTYRSRMITLNVHSSLEAVGLLARITTTLAGHGISVNAVSAFYHDHLFVPTARADEALALLYELTT